ncbi:MAG: NYN domain-containing protein [Acidobacteriota bacterium]
MPTHSVDRPVTKDVAVYIDYENLYISLRSTVRKNPDFDLIMEKCRDFGRVTVARAYADWSEFARVVTSQMFSSGIEPIFVPTRKFYDAKTRSQATKNSVDIHIVIDIIKDVLTSKNIDTFVLISGDRDFVPLMNQIRAAGKEVFAIGVAGCTSSELAVAVDKMYYYHQLLQTDEETAVEQQEVYGKLARAVEIAKARGYSATLGVLKPIMREIVSDFDETKFRTAKGDQIQKFKDFVIEAERAGFVRVHSPSGGGGLEVLLAGESASSDSSSSESSSSSGSGRSRSGSRRRGGRRDDAKEAKDGKDAKDQRESSESSEEGSEESEATPRRRSRRGSRGGRGRRRSSERSEATEAEEVVEASEEDLAAADDAPEPDLAPVAEADPEPEAEAEETEAAPADADEPAPAESDDSDGDNDNEDLMSLPEESMEDLKAMLDDCGRTPSQRRLIARLKKGAAAGELKGEYREGQFLLMVRKALEDGLLEKVSKGFYSGLRWKETEEEPVEAS